MSSILILFATLSGGHLLRRQLPSVYGEVLSLWLNRYVIYIALPALVLVYIPRIDPDASVWTPVLSAWGLFLLSSLAVLIAGRIARWPRDLKVKHRLCSEAHQGIRGSYFSPYGHLR